MIHARPVRPSLASVAIAPRRVAPRATAHRVRLATAPGPELRVDASEETGGVTAADLRFFLSCYLGGLVFFATLLS